MKLPNFTLYKGRNQAISTFSFSFWTWIIWFLGIQLQESSPTFDKSNWDGIYTIKILKNENSLFRRHFCCPCRPLILIIVIYLYPRYWPFLGKLTTAGKHGTNKREIPCLAHPQVYAQSLIPFIYELQSTKHVNNFTNNCIYSAKNKKTTQVIYLQCLSLHSFCIFSNNLQNIPAKEKHKQRCHQTNAKMIRETTFQGLKKVKE